MPTQRRRRRGRPPLADDRCRASTRRTRRARPRHRSPSSRRRRPRSPPPRRPARAARHRTTRTPTAPGPATGGSSASRPGIHQRRPDRRRGSPRDRRARQRHDRPASSAPRSRRPARRRSRRTRKNTVTADGDGGTTDGSGGSTASASAIGVALIIVDLLTAGVRRRTSRSMPSGGITHRGLGTRDADGDSAFTATAISGKKVQRHCRHRRLARSREDGCRSPRPTSRAPARSAHRAVTLTARAQPQEHREGHRQAGGRRRQRQLGRRRSLGRAQPHPR